MHVICKANNFLELKDNSAIIRIQKYIRYPDGQLNLDKNQGYCVYGIVFRENYPWYYMCLNDDDESPTAYPAELFSITDERLSQYWKLSGYESAVVFKEWADDSSFYERLIDGDPSAIALFNKYQELMDIE